MANKTILAIDDDLMLLELIKRMLSDIYQVETVNSAANALNFMNNNPVDIVLLDIEMPNINGFQFLSDIREIPSYMTVPIIIVSGNSGADFHEQAKKSSAFDVLGKPVNKEVLLQTIEKAINLSV